MKIMRAGERRRVTLSGASPTTADITSLTTNAEASILKVEETSTTAETTTVETTSVDMTLKENTTTDEPTTRACTTTIMAVKTSKTTSNKCATVERSTNFDGVDRARRTFASFDRARRTFASVDRARLTFASVDCARLTFASVSGTSAPEHRGAPPRRVTRSDPVIYINLRAASFPSLVLQW